MTLENILKQAVTEGAIKCPNCGNLIEPDAPKCVCGWKNPLPAEGYI